MSELRHASLPSPLGELLLLRDDAGLVGLYMQDGPGRRELDPSWRPDHLGFAAEREQLGEYFAGARTAFDLALAPRGTDWQLGVWRAVERIPYGKTETYGDLAARLERHGAARAVGAANAVNPISIVIPCHRLVGADGTPRGYAGGVERKLALLELERL